MIYSFSFYSLESKFIPVIFMDFVIAFFTKADANK